MGNDQPHELDCLIAKKFDGSALPPLVSRCALGNAAGRMNPNLTVIALLNAKPGKENEVKRELLSLVEPSRKDAGCVNYDLHQSVENPVQFMFHENWTSKAHLDQHLAKPDLQSVLGRVGQMLAEPPSITLWEKLPLA